MKDYLKMPSRKELKELQKECDNICGKSELKRYLIYHIRWQISAWVMLPLMIILESNFPLWANLMAGQFFGALVFWCVDKWIFKK